MTSIFAGSGLGLFGSSLTQTNGYGANGNPKIGKGTDQVEVNAADGNLVISNQDEFISAPGLSDAIGRTYNSLSGTLGLIGGGGYNGDQWQFSFERSLNLSQITTLTPHGAITRTTADGHTETFTYNATSGNWISKNGSGAYDQLQANPLGGYNYIEGGTGNIEGYNSSGQLVTETDQNGNRLIYGYTNNSLLGLGKAQVTSIIDSSGQIAYLDYGGTLGTNLIDIRVMGRAPGAAANAPLQQLTRIKYGYDTLNRLTSVTVELTPNNSSTTFDSNVYTTTYTYGTGNLLTGIAQSDGTSLAIAYQPVVNGTNTTTEVSTLTDGNGRVTSFAYNTTTNVTTVTDPLGNVTQYTYNAANAAVAPDELTRVTLPTVNGTTPNLQYVYDANGNISQVTDAAGRVYTYTYDGDGNLLRSQDSLGNTIDRTYDAKDHLTSETQYTVPATGSQPPSGALTTQYVYDGNENLVYTVTPDGHVSQNIYASNGERTSAILYTGNAYTGGTYTQAALAAWVSGTANKAQTERTDYAYDLTGQIQTVTRWNATDSTGAGINDGKQSVSRYVYDVAGRLLIAIDPRAASSVPTTTAASGQPYVTSYAYDGLNRVTSVIDSTGRTTTTTYNDAGRAITVTLPGNRTITSKDDADDNVISVAKAGSAGQALGTTSYTYDADSNQVSATDPTGQTTYTLYDAENRVSGTLSPQGELTEYVYNNDNQVIATHQYATLVTASALNASGNSVAIASIRPAASPLDRTTSDFYDAGGRLIYQVQAENATTNTVTGYQYDGAGRKISSTQYAFNLTTVPTSGNATDLNATVAANANAANDRTTRYFYDGEGDLTGTLDPAGYLTQTVYDDAGEVASTTAYATPTATANRASGTLASLIPASDPVNDQTTYTFYDGKGEVSSQIDAGGYLTTHVYDAAGNQIGQTRYATPVSYSGSGAAPMPTASAQDQTSSAVYDALNRVTQQTDVQGTVTNYTYDIRGFLTSETTAAGTTDARTTTYLYDDLGRPIDTLSGIGSAVYTSHAGNATQQAADVTTYATKVIYDNDGHQIQTTDADGHSQWFYYDTDGRLAYTVDAGGDVTQTQYNAFGNVVGTVQYATPIATTGLTGGYVPTASSGDANFYNALVGNAAATSNVLNRKKTFAYADDRGLETQSTDGNGFVTTDTYNAFGQLASAVTDVGATPGALTRTDQYAYDARGELLQTTQDAGGIAAVSKLSYDAFGRVTQTQDPDGNLTVNQYDRLGRVVTVTDALGQNTLTTYDAFGRVLTSTDRTGNVTTYSYNDATQTRTVTTPEGIVLSTTKNRYGQTLSVTDGNGIVTAYTYDLDGNLKTTTVDPGSGTNPVTGQAYLNLVTTNNYDNADLLTSTVDARNTTTAYTYSPTNRVITRTVDPAGLKLVTTYAYDAFGDAFRVTDPTGTITETVFDKDGQSTAVIVDTAGLKLATTYTYDGLGDQLTVTEGLQASGSTGNWTFATAPNTLPKVTQYTYDKLGRRTAQTVDPGSGTNPATGQPYLNLTTSYTYDASGNLLTKTDANNNLTRYVYDADRRLVFTINASGNVSQTVYDADGRVVRSLQYNNPITLNTNTDATTVRDSVAYANGGAAYEGISCYFYSSQVAGSTAFIRFFNPFNGDSVYTTDPTQAASLQSSGYVDKGISGFIFTTQVAGTVPLYQLNFGGHFYTTSANERAAVISYGGTDLGIAGYVLPSAISGAIPLYRTYGGQHVFTTSAVERDTNVGNAANQHETYSIYDGDGRLAYSIDALGDVTGYRYDNDNHVIDTVRYATPLTAAQLATLTGNPTPLDVLSAMNGGVYTDDFSTGLSQYSDYVNSGTGIQEVNNRLTLTSQSTSAYTALLSNNTYDLSQTRVFHFEVTPQSTGGEFYIGADSNPSDQQNLMAHFSGSQIYAYNNNGGNQTNTLLGNYTAGTTYVVEVAVTGTTSTLYVYQKGQPRSLGYSQTFTLTWPNVRARIEENQGGNQIAYVDNFALLGSLPNSNPQDQNTRTIYDAAGRAVYTVDALGDVVKNGYDGDGNLIATTAYATPLTGTPTYTAAGLGASITANAATDRTTRYAYDTAGRQVYKIDPLGYVTQTRYDGAGRVTGTTKYNTPILVSILPANPQVSDIAAALAGQDGGFYDNFSEGLGGYSYIGGYGSAGIAVTNGRLTLTNASTTAGTILDSNRVHTISATATQAFHYEITPTTATNFDYVGADTNNGGQYSLALFYYGGIYVQGQNNGTDTLTQLGTYVPGTTYEVDVLVTASGSTVYIYAKGSSRSSGYSHSLIAAWTTARARIQANQGNNEVAYVDALVETNGLIDEDSAAVVAGTPGATQDTFNNGLANYSYFNGSATTGIQVVGHRMLLTTQTGTNATAIYGNTLASITTSTPQVYRYEFQPTAATGFYYLGVGSSGGAPYHLAAFNGGTIYAQSQGTTGNPTITALGTYTAGTTYIVEVVVTSTGSTLYVYPKNSTRASGYSNTFAYNWTNAAVRIQAQQTTTANNEVAYIDSITTSSSLLADDLDSPAGDETTTNVYDAAGRLSKTSDAEGNIQSYTYDGLGNKKTYTNQNGATWNYSYDAAGRLTDQISPQVAIGTSAPAGLTAANPFSSVTSADGKEVYVTGAGSGAIYVYNRQTDGTLALGQTITAKSGGPTTLVNPAELALSPDGTSLYVTDCAGNALYVYTRASNGQLTYAQTLTDGVNNADGLKGGFGVTVSADGKNVYVAASTDNSLSVYTRNTSNGTLTFSQVFRDGGAISGLNGAYSVVVSKDGASVYVSGNTDSAIAAFTRNTSTGQLTFSTAIKSTTYPTLTTPRQLLLSGDDKTLYVASDSSSSVIAFTRTVGTGALAYLASYTNGSGGVSGLQNVTALAASPDGTAIYALAYGSKDVVVFTRNTSTGALTFSSTASATTANGGPTLSNAYGLSVSPDGSELYAQSFSDNTFVVFAKNADSSFHALQVLQIGSNAYSSATVGIDTHFVYDGLGNLRTQIDNYGAPALSRVTSYAYDALGRQVQTTNAGTYTDPVSGISYGSQVGVYNATADTSTNGYLGEPTTPQSLTSAVTFDAFGNAIISKDAGGVYSYKVYDALGRVQYEIDADGYATQYGYDAFGNQTTVTRYAQQLTAGHTAGAAYTTAEVVSRLTPGLADRTITTSYDLLNRKTSVVQPQVYSYDSLTQTSAIASPTTTYQYDAYSDTIQQNILKSVSSTGGQTWDSSYSYYDGDGNQTATIDPMGYLTQKQYTAEGQVADEKEWATALAAGSYTSASFTAPTFAGASAAGPVPATLFQSTLTQNTNGFSGTFGTNFVQGSTGLVLQDTFGNSAASTVAVAGTRSYTESAGQTTSFTYNLTLGSGTLTGGNANAGRLVGIGGPSFGLYLYLSPTGITTFEIDGSQNYYGPSITLPANTPYQLQFVLDSQGATMYLYPQGAARSSGFTYRFDASTTPANVTAYITATKASGSGSGEAPLTISQLTETNGTEANLSVADLAARSYSNVRETQYGYDRLGREVTETHVGVVTTSIAADGHVQANVQNVVTSSKTYDGAGNVIRSTDGTGATTLSFYDALGRLVDTIGPSNAPSTAATLNSLTGYTYDALGDQLSTTKYASGSSRIAVQTQISDLPTLAANAANDATSYELYDILGRVTKQLDANGNETDTAYDAYGNVAKTEIDFVRADGTTGHKVQIYRYDGRGLETDELDRLESGNLADHTIGYDAFGEVVDKGFTGGDATDASLIGTLTQQFAPTYTQTGAAIPARGFFEQYSYDDAGRLVYTNANGIGTATLSDLKGNTTAQIISTATDTNATLGLSSYFNSAANPQNSPAAVATLTSGVRRTETVYNADKQAIQQRQAAFTETPFQILTAGGPVATGLDSNNNTIFQVAAIDGATPTLQIEAPGGTQYSTVPLTFVTSSSPAVTKVWQGTVTGTLTGNYQYKLSYAAAGQPAPIEASVGTVTLNPPAAKALPISLTQTTINGIPYFVFQSTSASFSLAGITAMRISSYRTVGGGTQVAQYETYPVTSVGLPVGPYGQDYGIPVPNNQPVLYLSPIGTAQPGTTDLSNSPVTGSPTAASAAQAFLGELFQGALPYSSIPANLTLNSFQYKPAGSGPDESWITATSTGPAGDVALLNYISTDSLPSFDFKVNFNDPSHLLANLKVNGVSVGDANGNVYGTYVYDTSQTPTAPTGYPAITYQPTETQTLDRWGNVLSTTDADNITTSYRYDEFNRAIEQTQAQVSAYTDRGTSYQVTPKSETAYDADGRVIGTTDADGNLTTSTYSAAGELISQTDGDRATTNYAYNALGEKTTAQDPDGHLIQYGYDHLGQQISESDPAKTAATTTSYDALGDVVSTNGQVSYVYDGFGHILTQSDLAYTDYSNAARQQKEIYVYNALGQKIKQTDGNGNFNSYTYNSFGQELSSTGLSTGATAGNQTSYVYDDAGDKIEDKLVIGGFTYAKLYTYYANGLLQSIFDPGQNDSNFYNAFGESFIAQPYRESRTDYAYDAAGRLIHTRFEELKQSYLGALGSSSSWSAGQDTLYSYDADGRLSTATDPNATVSYFYDAQGNRKLVDSQYSFPYTTVTAGTFDHRYRYDFDADNRVQNSIEADVTRNTSGVVTGLANAQATYLQYDAAGNRVSETDFAQGGATIALAAGSTDATIYSALSQAETPALQTQILANGFDADNRLIQTSKAGSLVSTRSYNNLDQVTEYDTYTSSGALSARQFNTYYADGTLAQSQTKNSSGSVTGTNQYRYDNAGNQSFVNLLNSSGSSAGSYAYTYQDGDNGYEQTLITATANGNTNTTIEHYDFHGQLALTSSSGNSGQIEVLTTDNTGHVIYKFTPYSASDFDDALIYQGGNELGSTEEVLGGSNGPAYTFHFGNNFTPISDAYPAISPSSYVVQTNDTLQSIAQAVYGDASLWYVIADANSIEQGAPLVAGTVLNLPNTVVASHDNASTFKPYNPSQIVGDITPQLPPPSKPSSDFLAAAIIAVVAAVATVVTAGAALSVLAPTLLASDGILATGAAVFDGVAFSTAVGAAQVAAVIGAAAIGGAVGSIASQLTGDALGVSHGFSFAKVAVGAFATAATVGIAGGVGLLDASPVVAGLEDGALDSVADQGIGIALGQQKSFSWSSVAAGALVSGAFAGSGSLYQPLNKFAGITAQPFTAEEVFGRTADGLVSGVATQEIALALGGHGKVNIASVAADSFGNALGDSIVGQIEETNGEQLAAQLEQGLQPIQQANEDQVNQQFVEDTQQDSDEISAQFQQRESLSNEAASIEQDNLANAEAAFTAPPPVAALAPVELNVAPQAGSDTGGGNTAVLASNATTTALAINAGNGQSIFTGQGFQIASSGQAYSDASYTNGTDATASPGIQSGAPYEFVSPADQEEQQLVGNALNGGGIALNTSPVASSSSQGFFASVGEAAETESEAYAAGSNVAENFLRATYDFQLAGGIAGAAGLAVGIGTGLQYEGVDLTGDNPISIDSSLAGRVQSSLYNSLALGPSGPDGQSAYNVGIDLNLGASLVLAGAGVIRGGIGLFGAEGAADSAIDSIAAENIQATNSEAAAAATERVSSRPAWLQRLDAGNDFNAEREAAYPYNEVYIDNPSGEGYTRLDSYNPDAGEIVSRKFTQLSDIQTKTAVGYINEIPAKYPVGATIADVPSSGSLAGDFLQGQYILEVPVQVNPIPQAVLDAANNSGVLIRDVNGKIY